MGRGAWAAIAIGLLAYPVTVHGAAPVTVTVAPDGSGDFKTIQQAIDHAPFPWPNRIVIQIKPGEYHERLKVPQERAGLTLRGLGKTPSETSISYSMSAKQAGGTFFSSVVEVDGTEFEAENLTFENTFGTGSQAVAVSVHSDKAVFRKCRFLGWQDTLYAALGRQYYADCFIEGHVDFIFGNAAAVFENCEIHSRGDGFIAAESRLRPDQSTGFVFYKCKLTGENTQKGVFLGRPWRPYSRVVYIDCRMDSHIRPEGWDNWNNEPENEKTAWYGEYGSSGPGATMDKRAGWAHQLKAEEAGQFLPQTFLRGNDGWDPAGSR